MVNSREHTKAARDCAICALVELAAQICHANTMEHKLELLAAAAAPILKCVCVCVLAAGI